MSRSHSPHTSRISIFKYIVCAIILGYAAYLFVIQVVRGYFYAEQAQRSQQRVNTIPARRGTILDSQGNLIADNTYNYSLSITLGSLTNEQLSTLSEKISHALALPSDMLRNTILNARKRNAYSVEIADSLSISQISYIAEHARSFPNVHWHVNASRFYPLHEELAHVTGYVGNISAEELRVLHNQEYQSHSIIGKNGLEAQYDLILRGKDGSTITRVDAFGAQVNIENTTASVPGNNIITSIDTRIQKLAWQALDRRIGSVVVLQPHTGEILAMVSYPSYNPNQFYSSNAQQVLDNLLRDVHSPLINRAVQTVYPPASIFKVLMATTIVNENVYDVYDTVFCRGYYELGNSVLYEWERRNFGYLDLFGGMANSSNVYFWTLGVEHVGIERIVDYSHRFGFGSKTGIDLPNEATGIVPDPEWKQLKFNQRWTAGDTANVSIGQGFINTTPLQIANMVAAISNNGTVYKPHILKEIQDSQTGEIIQRHTPELLYDLSFDPETFQTIQKTMEEVVKNGTGSSVITTPLVSVAGKTGTSEVQKGSEKYHSWFAAYAPADAPPESRVVVVVFVDAANEWEWWAPKAANIILHGIFANVNYERTIYELRNSPRGLWYL